MFNIGFRTCHQFIGYPLGRALSHNLSSLNSPGMKIDWVKRIFHPTLVFQSTQSHLKMNCFKLSRRSTKNLEIASDPSAHSAKNHFANDRAVAIKIIVDINDRLKSVILNAKKFESYRQALKKIRDDGIRLINKSTSSLMISSNEMFQFVINYVEIMYELLKSQDNNIHGTYYTDFAKDFIKNLFDPDNSKRIFFTFKNLDEQYFIDTRPFCIYPVHLMSLPEFSSEKPLIPTNDVKGYVESKFLDFREVTFHDIGHAHVMHRQDKWLFGTCNRSPVELIAEWLRNKNWYMEECEKLSETNHSLYKAVKLYLFEMVHDRGYQFYLPILKQQFKALKNLENLKSRILRGEFDITYDRSVVEHLDEAREWLLDITDKFIERDNIDKIEKYKDVGYQIKKYPDVEHNSGIPVGVTINKNGKILVNFASNGIAKATSLYEIELIRLPVTDTILSDNKIDNINKWISFLQHSGDEFIQLDTDANVLNLHETIIDKDMEIDDQKKLKKIEIYKLERLLNLIKSKKTVKFSISKLPEIYESSEILINRQKGIVTIDNGLCFKLNEVGIESKSKLTLKYINLNPNDRFVSEKLLRNSYIRDPNSKNFHLKPYVTINDELELGIVDTKKHIELAKAVSSVLSRSIDRAKDSHGGYLPSAIVDRAQLEYVSPYAVSNLWGKSGYRFVLSRKIDSKIREVIGTALITNDDDTLFFFTNKYNNLKFSTINEQVDFDLSVDGKHKWFDKFDMPKIEDYKPVGCHQLANFAVEKIDCRGMGFGKLLIAEIIKNYALNHPRANIQHSQPLIRGKGIYQIADPSWRKYMLNIGFKLRRGAETFYMDREWDRLPSVRINGKQIDHVSYNQMYGLPEIHENRNLDVNDTDIDIKERIPKVVKLANSGIAKLQYFQMIYMFK